MSVGNTVGSRTGKDRWLEGVGGQRRLVVERHYTDSKAL